MDKIEFVGSGHPLLNLALSKNVRGGYGRGRIVNVIGDGGSGKTGLALEFLASAYHKGLPKSKSFSKTKNIKMIYNNVEGVMDMPIEDMYGKDFVDAVDWRRSIDCEEFGRDCFREIENKKENEALLYILDSIDSLDDPESRKKLDKSIKEDKDMEGMYATGLAKYFSKGFFRRLCNVTHGKDVTILLISQVRQNLDLYGKNLYRVGGKALDFYVHQAIWLYNKGAEGDLTKQIKNKKYKRGNAIWARIERNKCSTPWRDALIKFIWGYGLDVFGDLVKFTEAERPEDRIREIAMNKEEYEKELDKAQAIHDEIEEKLKVDRPRRF